MCASYPVTKATYASSNSIKGRRLSLLGCGGGVWLPASVFTWTTQLSAVTIHVCTWYYNVIVVQ